MRRSTVSFSQRFVTVITVGVLVLAAVALRGYRLASPALWGDEAESALNALTIVADGVPGDHFLGQPLYENTLVRPWPGNAEYEFRDLSYSDRGLAVYHSWLPLYSIAAAFRLAGVTAAATRSGTPLRDASQTEIDYWTAVPRLPAVAFGALSVVAAWALGRRIHGQPVGIALAFAVATSDFFVDAGRQARYYSASVAGSAICGLAIWNAWRRGRLSDHALAGLAVGVLFHIHSLSAVAMSALYVASCPLGRRQPRLWLRVLAAGTVGAVLVLPWAAWSGLLGQTDRTPAAREYIDLPMVLSSLPSNPVPWTTLGVGLAWFALASRRGSRLSDRWRRPILENAAGLYFAITWMTVAYLIFFALMPAASFFPYRLNLMIVVPGLLVLSLLVAAVCRAVRPTAAFLPVVGLVTLLVLMGELPPRLPRASGDTFAEFIGAVRSWTLGPGGRIFASPNEHLVLTYYSGRPVQSIAPVRREWLDHFANDLIMVEGRNYSAPRPNEVQETALRHGRTLTETEAMSRALEAARLATALELQAYGASVMPPPRVPDSLDQALVDMAHDSTRVQVMANVRGTPLGRDSTLATYNDFRNAFFYWFSDPDQRKGPGLNYRACRAQAHAHVHPSGFTVLDCRRTREPPLVPVAVHQAGR